jgi:hypothetical protein
VLDGTAMRINGPDLYAYCGGNPVMRTDPMGRLPWWANLLIGIAIVAVLVVATVATAGLAGVGAGAALAAGFTGATITATTAAGATAAAAATILSCATAGAILGGSAGFIFGGLSIDQNGPHFNLDAASSSFLKGTISGALLGITSSFAVNAGIKIFLGGTINATGAYISESLNGKVNPDAIFSSFVFGGISSLWGSVSGSASIYVSIFGSTVIDAVENAIENLLESMDDKNDRTDIYAYI